MFNLSSDKIKSAIRFWIPYLGAICALFFVWTVVSSQWKHTILHEENLAETKIIKSQQALIGINNTILSEIASSGIRANAVTEDTRVIQNQLKLLHQKHEILTNQILQNQENLKKDRKERETVVFGYMTTVTELLKENNNKLRDLEKMLKARIN